MRIDVAELLYHTAASYASGPPFDAGQGLVVTSAAVLRSPGRADLTVVDRAYLIGMYDNMMVNVYGLPEMSKPFQAGGSGRISLASIIETSGKVSGELTAVIAGCLRGANIRDSQVSVNLTDNIGPVIAVDSKVKCPGLCPVIGRITFSGAVATANGAGKSGELNKIAGFQSVNGARMAALSRLKVAHRGLYADSEVFAGDTVIVGNSQIRQILRDVFKAAPLLTAPIITLARH